MNRSILVSMLLVVLAAGILITGANLPEKEEPKIAYFKWGNHTIYFHSYYINVTTGAFDKLTNTSGTQYASYDGANDEVDFDKPINLGTNELTCTDCIDDSDFNHTGVYFLNYSDAGTYTTGKIIVGNGTLISAGSGTVIEGALSSVDYITFQCTSNTSLVVGSAKTGANTFSIRLYDVTNGGAIATTDEYINWTAVGTP